MENLVLFGRNDDWRLPGGGPERWPQYEIEGEGADFIQHSHYFGFPPAVVIGREKGKEEVSLFIHADKTGGVQGSAFAREGMATWEKFPLSQPLRYKGYIRGVYRGKTLERGEVVLTISTLPPA